MDIFTIVFIVFIVFSVLRKVKKGTSTSNKSYTFTPGSTVTPAQNNQYQNRQVPGQQVNQQMTNRTVPNNLYRQTTATTSSTSSTAHTKPVHTMNSKNTVKNTSTVSATNTRPVSKTADTDKNKTTTQKLHEKAMQDKAQHQIEKRQQDQENRQVYGNLRYAGRFLPGDPIPKGQKLVYCQYCGAENIVPEFEAKHNFNCYFCREKL